MAKNTYINTKDSICIFSYNSRGFSEDKQDTCKLLMLNSTNHYPILCNQENFLLQGNRLKIKQCLPNARIFYKKAIKDSLEGRPKNGMFIAVPDEIKEHATDVSPKHWRVQAIILKTYNNRILIINSYFPTDPRTVDFDTTELQTTLSAINDVILTNDFDNIVWAGDINADFVRQTKFTSLIENFISENTLVKSWDKCKIDFTHSYDLEDQSYTSIIDHFFWSESTASNIKNADVLHLPSNTSDHCPIYCSLKINISPSSGTPPISKNSKPSWKKATDTQKDSYKTALEQHLRKLEFHSGAKHCKNVHCQSENHQNQIDEFLKGILKSINSAAVNCLPCAGCSDNSKKTKTRFSSWQEDVQPFKDTAMFWHSIWLSAGRPLNTELHNIMKKTRNQYHYQIRKNRKMTDIIKKNQLLNACINNNGDIFEEIKKLRKALPTVSTMIDGVTCKIESHFANTYRQLYNSIDDGSNLTRVTEHLSKAIDSNSHFDVDKITPALVMDAINHLKDKRSDPINDFTSDCLKNAPLALCEQLSILFKQFLIHGHASSILMVSTLIPLIKDKLGDTCSSSNYRSIALSSLFLKIFDWILLLLFDDEMKIDELQFGFQRKTSTTMCTWLAVETIDYFLRNGSDVFTCVMDMSKAFDLVQHSTLFWKLIDKGISPIYIRLLLAMYCKQQANVRWNGKLSHAFPVKNGVKQGAVISPFLYCIYIDDLFKILRKKRNGCWVNSFFVGIVGYADDLLLIAPSIDSLQDMVKSCEKYGASHNLTFSTHSDIKKCKTKCMAFIKKQRPLRHIKLNGNNLPWVDSFKHLGVKVGNKSNGLAQDLMAKRALYVNKVNELTQEFHYADPSTKIKINNIFNTSFYGCQLWDLFSNEAERLGKSWNISQRIMLDIPRNTHRYFLEPLSGTQHIQFSLYRRFIKFVNSIKNSKKPTMRHMLSVIKHDCRSTTGRNLRKLMLLQRKPTIEEITIDQLTKSTYMEIPTGDEWKINLVKELLHIKNGHLDIENLNKAEATIILQNILTC